MGPDGGQGHDEVEAGYLEHALAHGPHDVLAAMLPQLAQIVSDDFYRGLFELLDQGPGGCDVRGSADLGRQVILVDEQEFEPSQHVFSDGHGIAAGKVALNHLVVEDCRRDLFLVLVEVAQVLPVGDELGGVLAARVGDSRVAKAGQQARSAVPGEDAYVVPKSIPMIRIGASSPAEAILSCGSAAVRWLGGML